MESADTGWELVAIMGEEPRVHPLPHKGSVVLGRGEAADLALEHASVSRRHAVLHVTPEAVEIEDLGSANGSRVVTVVADANRTAQTHDQRLAAGARVVLQPTSSVHLGSVVVLVRRAAKAEEPAGSPGVVAHSPAMKRAFELVERIAQAPLSILLVGETGVGKDVMARAIHAASPRRAGPFVAINCAALPEHLVESELFGHEKGAFTGANQPKVGLLEAAHGGTAFLDEVGELPLPQQSKLLRALEERAVLRVGALKPRPIDVRFVAATNRDPARDGERFRRDLYFRLSGMTLALPPLRERTEDLVPLAELFAQRAAKELGRKTPRFDDAALAALRGHPFPGNVRELRNVVERAVALAEGTIGPEHLHLDDVAPAPPAAADERQRIVDALAQCGGNQTRAAALLGISRRTLVSRLGQYGIARPLSRRED